MSKKIFGVVSLVFMLLVFAGTSHAAEKKMKLRLGHVLDQQSTWHIAATKFAELTAAKTNGAIVVEVFPNSQLGNERDMLEGLQMGTIDAVITGDITGNFYEPLTLFGLPYLFNDMNHLRRVMYGPIGEELKDGLLRESDIVALEFLERGPRQLTSNVPVNSVKDILGLKIRVPEIPISIDSWKAFGANPTPMAFGELYTALQQKTIDAQENPFNVIASGKLYEVQKYIALTDHLFGYAMLSVSSKVWNSLTPENKQVLRDAAKGAREHQNKVNTDTDVVLEKLFTEKGVTFTKPDKAGFKEKVMALHKSYAEKLGKEMYDKIAAAGQ